MKTHSHSPRSPAAPPWDRSRPFGFATERRVHSAVLVRNLLGLAWLGVLLAANAAGDLTVSIVDMQGQAVPGAQSGRATLRGEDAAGFRTVTTRPADAAGRVVFSEAEIRSVFPGSFGYAIETAAGSDEVRALLHDPFGAKGTYIAYASGQSQAFVIPTPRAGHAAPEVRWNGAASQLSFPIDLGNRTAADLWLLRAIWQRKAPSALSAGWEYGLIPVLSRAWLLDHAYALTEEGLAAGQVGRLRLRRGSYDETFPARRSSAAGGGGDWYELFLVNSLWRHNLPGTYDAAQQRCTFTFDPAALFLDSEAPGWDGPAMKDGVPGFVALQAQAWIWHAAGAQGGLAIDWGSGVAPSVFHPIRINDQSVRLLTVRPPTQGVVRVEVAGNANLPYTLQAASRLAQTTTWTDLVKTQVSTSPFFLLDPAPAPGARWYRVRQP